MRKWSAISLALHVDALEYRYLEKTTAFGLSFMSTSYGGGTGVSGLFGGSGWGSGKAVSRPLGSGKNGTSGCLFSAVRSGMGESRRTRRKGISACITPSVGGGWSFIVHIKWICMP